MRVKRNNSKKVDLKVLKAGDIFESFDDVYIKTLIDNDDYVSCIDVKDGSVVDFTKEDICLVTPLHGEFICNQ